MTRTDVDVAVVGAGFAGIGMAAGLLRAGHTDLVVLERGADVGGTWRDNTYPGAACDVPSNLYSFSFAPNPDWSRSFSPQPEIQGYLRRCADRFGVRPHIRFGHTVTRAAWDEAAQHWVLDVDRAVPGDGETAGHETVRHETVRCTARVLVSARGPLSEPKLPAVAGLDRFTGTVFHSARWDHGHRLAGERVAVVGTGASAIQFVPQIQPEVASLTVFQRTPPWIIPRRDRAFTAAEHRLYAAAPAAQQAARAAVYWGREGYVLGFVGHRFRRLAGRLPAAVARAHLARQVPDPALRAVLTPDYQVGCKRVLISSDYYPAVCRPNVEVVPDAVAEVRERSVVTAGGQEREVDTIIFGTGFDVTAHDAAERTHGIGGVSLADAWAGRLSAYKGTTVAGFPNLFLMVGPNAGLGHTSIVFIIESQVAYVLGALHHMRRHHLASVEVTAGAQQRWTDRLDRASRDTVWTDGGCRSYYLDDRGRNIAIWPGSSWSFHRALRRFDADAYRTVPGRRPRTAPAGAPALAAAVCAETGVSAETLARPRDVSAETPGSARDVSAETPDRLVGADP
ncbi:MAG TPA: NAD(P)/FAD-dependent oxidoreductase [Acidimicrobiales bacterium]|nr:NAD(P)/FAD-dependent oxidoreductase [Acidimicrobiales bacterium]